MEYSAIQQSLWLAANSVPLIPMCWESLNHVVWADEVLQTHALHFVSKLMIPMYLQIIWNYMASTKSVWCICILVYIPNVIY